LNLCRIVINVNKIIILIPNQINAPDSLGMHQKQVKSVEVMPELSDAERDKFD